MYDGKCSLAIVVFQNLLLVPLRPPLGILLCSSSKDMQQKRHQNTSAT